MYQPYVRFANPQTELDATAKNPVGCIYSPPSNQGLPNTTKGLGAQPVFKYVYFNAAAAPTAQATPAPVYWTDETFTTVSSNESDSYTASIASVAGYWMPNTTALGASQTGAQWGAQFQQSYGWIQIGGLLSTVAAPTSQALGGFIIGAAGSWASAVSATVSNRLLGIQWSSVSGGIVDVLVGGLTTFWGS